MSRISLAVAGVLAIVCAAPALAEVVDLQPVTPIRRVEPVVLGFVTSVGTHRIEVAIPRSEAMTFEFDSRTVMPRDLPADTPVRIDFRLLDSGAHFANRVTPILPGSHDWNSIENLRVSQQLTPVPPAEAAVSERATMEPAAEPVAATSEAAPARAATETSNARAVEAYPNRITEGSEAENRLPRTASELPLLLTLGTASVAAAIALSIRRRRV